LLIHPGLDKQTAQKVLKAWEASGASSPDELRKLLVKRSVQSAGTVLIQTLLDAGTQWRGAVLHVLHAQPAAMDTCMMTQAPPGAASPRRATWRRAASFSAK
jgi:hypothetical protein